MGQKVGCSGVPVLKRFAVFKNIQNGWPELGSIKRSYIKRFYTKVLLTDFTLLTMILLAKQLRKTFINY
jgi:hypothetical protein